MHLLYYTSLFLSMVLLHETGKGLIFAVSDQIYLHLYEGCSNLDFVNSKIYGGIMPRNYMVRI